MAVISKKNLQELIDANIITNNTADEIEAFYTAKKNAAPQQGKLNIIFGILGALLISLSIILFIAHNWDQLNKTTKTILAFLPLTIAQLLCVFVLFYKKESNIWRETSAIVLFFAVPTAISVLSQVYHIDGTIQQFLFTWILLTAAIVYLMRSTITALLLLVIATWYANAASYGYYNDNNIPWLYLAVLVFLTPHYLSYLRNRESNYLTWYNWLIPISLLLCIGSFQGREFNSERIVFTGYAALLTLFYQIGKRKTSSEKFFTNSYLKLGTLGIIIIFLMLSFESFWRDFQFDKNIPDSPFVYMSAILFCTSIYIFIKQNKKFDSWSFDPVEIALYILVFAMLLGSIVGVLVINGWLIVIALWYIIRGSAQNDFALMNFGLVIIAALATMRFFDEEIPFVWRGFFFFIAGIGFFAANYNLIRKRKRLE